MAESRDRISTDTVEERWKKWQERPRTEAWAERYGGHIDDVERLFMQSLDALKAERKRQRRQAEAEREQERRRIEGAAERQRIKLEAEAAREREAAALRLARVTRRAAIIVSVLLLVAVGVSLLARNDAPLPQRQQAAVAKQNIETSLKLATAAQGEIRGLLDKGVISVSAAKLLLTSANAMYARFTDRDQDPEIRSGWAGLLLASANSSMALQDQKKALQLSQQAQATAKQLVATDPENVDYQFLFYSADYFCGDAEAYTSSADAMRDYQAALSIAQTLAKTDSTHYVWRQRAAFVMNKIGDIYGQLSEPDKVLATYRSALEVNQQLAKDHPDVPNLQRDLGISLIRVGDAEADTNPSDALDKYKSALAIGRTLAAQNPSDASLQSNLSAAYNRVASILVQQKNFAEASLNYNEALTIRQTLAKSDPSNPSWQTSLALQYADIGNMLMAKPDFAAAAENYRQAIAIRKALATLDPNNFTWLRILADGYQKLAAALADGNDLAAALAEYDSALTLRAKIAGKYPDSADRQRELIDEYLAIGDILFKQNNESGAAEQYQNALKVAQDFQAENPTSTSLASITHLITQKIQDLRVSQEGK
jgi:tetratricopeptide (TPR) repeat protein